MEELSNCKRYVKGVVTVLAQGRAVTKDENVLDGRKKQTNRGQRGKSRMKERKVNRPE